MYLPSMLLGIIQNKRTGDTALYCALTGDGWEQQVDFYPLLFYSSKEKEGVCMIADPQNAVFPVGSEKGIPRIRSAEFPEHTDDEKIDDAAARILKEHKAAFLELAK